VISCSDGEGRMELRCAFLNCANLFPVGANPGRFDGDAAALEAKINALAATLRGFFQPLGHGPDIVGLCEVADLELAVRLADAISPETYEVVWSGVPAAHLGDQTGLA